MYFLKLSTINSNLRKIKIHSQQSKQRSPVIIPNIMDGKRIILFTSSECYFQLFVSTFVLIPKDGK